MEYSYLVIANIKKEGIYKYKVCIRWDKIKEFFYKYFTKQVEIEAPQYSEIYSITEKGMEKIDKLPYQIALFISRKII